MANEDIFHLGLKALIKNKEGKILVLKGNKKHRITGQDYWDLPGGRIQKNEDFQTALKREIAEEIGIQDIKILDLLDASVAKIRVTDEQLGLILFTFICLIKDSEKITLTDNEHIDFGWFEPKDAANLLSIKFSDSLVKAIKNLQNESY